MLDYEKLANEVSALLKQKDSTFDNAFIAVMKQYPIITGEAWKEAKSKIGSILAKRPRKARTKKIVPPKTPTIFTVLVCDPYSVEFSSEDRITFKFGKDKEGTSVLFSHSGTCQPSEAQKKEAQAFAEKFFKQKELARLSPNKKEEELTSFVIARSSPTEFVLRVDNTFLVSFAQTEKSVTAQVTQNGNVLKQKDVPHELMKKARKIAMAHFRGAGTLPLNF